MCSGLSCMGTGRGREGLLKDEGKEEERGGKEKQNKDNSKHSTNEIVE